ncbi:hypothetical protein GGR58DRAFT_497433 [Xylaria digitata]|nr:hypothetical protein GGR58DRAFT_497433 [Xylaria digitata]
MADKIIVSACAILALIATVSYYSGLFDRVRARIQRHAWFDPDLNRGHNSELRHRVADPESQLGAEETEGENSGESVREGPPVLPPVLFPALITPALSTDPQ